MSANKQAKLSPDLLAMLVCPVTGGALDYDKKKNELVSKKARLAYPIIDGVPVLLETRARKIKNKN